MKAHYAFRSQLNRDVLKADGPVVYGTVQSLAIIVHSFSDPRRDCPKRWKVSITRTANSVLTSVLRRGLPAEVHLYNHYLYVVHGLFMPFMEMIPPLIG